MFLNNFRGVLPRVNGRLRQDQFAEQADNVNLESGGLATWPEVCPTCETSNSAATIIPGITECECFTLNDEIDWIKYPFGDCDLYFYIDDGELKVADEEMLCAGEWCYPSPPCPPSPAQNQASGGCDTAPMTYVYTYVNQFGFEGPPSRPFLGSLSGSGTTISGLSTPPPNYCISLKRIYRLEVGWHGGDSKVTNNSDYFLVAEVPAGTTTFTDTTSKLGFEMPLTSQRSFPPPDGLTSICALPSGAIAVTKDRTIYISDAPFLGPRPHAFSREHDQAMRSNIVSSSSNDNAAFFATDKYPGVLTWSSSENGGNYNLTEIEQNHPCLSKRSLVVEGGAAYYLSRGGLIALTPGSRSSGPNAQNITGPQWTLSQFSKIVDENSSAVIHDGKYFFTSPDNGGSVWVFYHGSSGKADSVELTGNSRITFMGRPSHLSIDDENVIMYENGGQLWGMDLTKDPCDGGCFECTECNPYYYKTSKIVENSLRNYGALKVALQPCKGRDVTVSLYRIECDEDILVRTVNLNHCDPVRLPKGYKSTDFYVVIEGCAKLDSVHIAATISDLISNPGGVAK